MIDLGSVLLVPAGDQAPVGRRLAAEGGRLSVSSGAPVGDSWVPAEDAQLLETDACGLYLLVGRATRVEGAGGGAELLPGAYQVVRRG